MGNNHDGKSHQQVSLVTEVIEHVAFVEVEEGLTGDSHDKEHSPASFP